MLSAGRDLLLDEGWPLKISRGGSFEMSASTVSTAVLCVFSLPPVLTPIFVWPICCEISKSREKSRRHGAHHKRFQKSRSLNVPVVKKIKSAWNRTSVKGTGGERRPTSSLTHNSNNLVSQPEDRQ